MQFGINLLAKEKPKALAEKEIIRKAKMIVGFAVAVYIFFILGLMAVFSYFSLEKRNLDTQITKLESTIKSYQKVENLEVLIKGRVSLAQKIIEPRIPAEAILVKIINSLEEGITVSALEFKTKNEISFSAYSENANSLESFLQKVKQIFQEEKYSLVRLDGITRDEAGGFSFLILAKK